MTEVSKRLGNILREAHKPNGPEAFAPPHIRKIGMGSPIEDNDDEPGKDESRVISTEVEGETAEEPVIETAHITHEELAKSLRDTGDKMYAWAAKAKEAYYKIAETVDKEAAKMKRIHEALNS